MAAHVGIESPATGIEVDVESDVARGSGIELGQAGPVPSSTPAR